MRLPLKVTDQVLHTTIRGKRVQSLSLVSKTEKHFRNDRLLLFLMLFSAPHFQKENANAKNNAYRFLNLGF